MERKLPDGWSWITLKDLSLEFINGGTPSTKVDSYWRGTIPWITSASITSCSVNEGAEHISEDAIKNSSANVIPEGNLLFVTRVGIGKAAVNKIECSFSQDITGIILNRELVIPEYIARYIQSPTVAPQLQSWARGATIKGLQRDQIEDLLIPTPPLETQRKIVAILDKAEETKRLRAQANELTQGLWQSVFEHIFGNPIKDGIKWDVVPIAELCQEINGAIKCGPFGSQLKKADFTHFGFKVYGQENVIDNDFSIGSRYIDASKYVEMRTFTLMPDDIVITRMGTVGEVAIVPENIECGIIDFHLIRLRLNSELIDAKYFTSIFKMPFVQSQLKKESRGAIMSGLNSAIIKKVCIPVPPMSLQKQYVSIMMKLPPLLAADNESSSQLIKLTNSLFSKAFTGELVA